MPLAPVLAALTVDAACGALAAAVANSLAAGPGGEEFFTGCALAAVLGHAVLTPGWVWMAGPLTPRTLMQASLMRAVVAGAALPCAVAAAGVVMTLLSRAAGGSARLDPGDTLALTASGAVIGLGAVAAQGLDRRLGLPRSPGWTHVAGAVAGLWLVIVATNLFSLIQHEPWTRVLLAIATVTVAGLPHTLLAVRTAAHAGHVFPAPIALKRRAAWCGAALVMAALGMTAFKA